MQSCSRRLRLLCSEGDLVCAGERLPRPEICDGVDNDCDGAVDNDPTDTGDACGSDVGECQPGALTCSEGRLVCAGGVQPRDEVCNGLDDDCDNAADEGAIDVGGVCGTNVGECRTGVNTCQGGALVCFRSVEPVPEVCDALDNDCDGRADEGGVCERCRQAGDERDCGTDRGECQVGTQVCGEDLFWGPCVGSVDPEPEVCDGLDNNCDGQVDEVFPGMNHDCGSNVGACMPGYWACVDGERQCLDEVGPKAELCNGHDDDCNGAIDDAPEDEGLGEPCGTDEGACEVGMLTCSRGNLICAGGVAPRPELCNGIDDDCDGALDEEPEDAGHECGEDEGECVPGLATCSEGQVVCVGAVGPRPELCDALDNDCNGHVDDEPEDARRPCGEDEGECVQGTTVCLAGELRCRDAVGPEPEACDVLDNDCDGQVDEDNVCEACNNGEVRACGTNEGECVAGRQTCEDDRWGRCVGSEGPWPEVCDTHDNDCDGEIDEEFPRQDEPCGRDVGQCQPGALACDAGEVVCAGGVAPVPEQCNDLDDDCDGAVDNEPIDAGVECGVDTGGCETGVTLCSEGVLLCDGEIGPGEEVCDGLDNDCDDEADEEGDDWCGANVGESYLCVDGRCVYDCPVDDYEGEGGNNTMDTAYLLEEDPPFEGTVCSTDQDFYAFDPCEGGDLTLEVTFDGDVADLDVQLLDEDGEQVAISAGTGSEERIFLEDVPAGRLYVRIYLFRGDEVAYTLTGGMECIEDDAFEDNDDLETATPLAPGAYPDLMVMPEDDDWYRFDVCDGGTLDVEVLFRHGPGRNLDLELYHEAGWLVAESRTRSDDELVHQEGLPGAAYLVRVFGVEGSTNRYDLVVGVNCDAPVEDDQFEENDAPEIATPLDPDQYVGLVARAADPDWYQVEVCPDGTLVAAIDILPRNDESVPNLDLAVWDARVGGDPVGSSRTQRPHEEVTWRTEGDATALVAVWSAQGEAGRYDLQLVTHCLPPDDALEVIEPEVENDAFETPAVVVPGNTEELVLLPADEDWYVLDVPCEDATVDAAILFEHAAGDLILAAYDAGGDVLAESQTRDDDEEVVLRFLPQGPLYLRVFGPGRAWNHYDLRLGLSCPAQEPDDRFEENDNASQAAPVHPEHHPDLVIVGGDDDWFAVDVCADGDLRVLLEFVHNDGDVDFEVLGPDGERVGGAASGDDNEDRLFEDLPRGRYLVRVYGYDGQANPSYAMTLELDCSIPDDAFEDNDDFDGAMPLDHGVHEDLVVLEGDEDWFLVDVCEGGTLNAVARFDPEVSAVGLIAYGSDGEPMFHGPPEHDGTATVVLRDLPADAYVLRVYLAGGAQARYTLAVGAACPEPEDDGLEENDNRAQARLLEPDTYPDLVVLPRDPDWYAVEVCHDGSLEVLVEFLQVHGNLDLQVLDEAGEVLAEALTEDDNELIGLDRLRGGVYFVRVFGPGGETNRYALTLAVDCLPNDDRFEENDAQDAARPLEPGLYEGLVVLSDDDDWYTVDVCDGATLEVALGFWHEDGDLDVSVLDEAGDVVDSATSADDNEVLLLSDLGAGTYAIRVYGFSGAWNRYVMRLAVSCPQDLDDDFEENDTNVQPTVLEPGAYDGLVCLDDDWYAIDVCHGGTLDVLIEFAHDRGDLDLYVWDANEEYLDGSESADDNERVILRDLAAGTYYVQIVGYLGAWNRYVGLLEVSCPNELDDGQEENDSPQQAPLLEPGEYPGLQALDEDWYHLRACGPGQLATIEALIFFEHAQGNLELELLDHNVDLVAGAYSPDDDEELLVEGLEPGGYFLRVFPAGDDTNAYDLLFDVRCVFVDDEHEPNDVLGEAAPLGPGVWEDLRAVPGNEDWYQVDVCEGGTLDVGMGYDGLEGNLDLAVYDAEGNLLASSNAVDGDWEWLTLPGLEEAPYFLLVWGRRGDMGWYTLEIDVACPQEGDDELEENDSWAQATQIGDEELPPLVILPEDEDWFLLDTCPEGTLTVSLDFAHDEGNLELELYAPGGDPSWGSYSEDDGEEVVAEDLPGGRIFVRVFGLDGAGAEYAMRVALDCTPRDDEYEPNDSLDEPAPLDEPGLYEDLRLLPDNEDWFAFEVCDGGTLDVALRFLHERGDLDLIVFNEAGDEVGASRGVGDGELVVGRDLPAGLYVAKVFGFGEDPTRYDLVWGVACPAQVEDDRFEENDNRRQAPRLEPGGHPELMITADDEDWFVVDTCRAGTLTVGITFLNDDGDLDLALFDGAGDELGSSLSMDDNEEVVLEELAGGPVFIMVEGWGGAENAYHLQIALDCEPRVDDEWEDNDVFAEAAPMEEGDYDGLRVLPRDDDWYLVDVACEGGTLDVAIGMDPEAGDLNLEVWSSGEELLAESATDGGLERLSLPDLAADLYAVRVYGQGGAWNDYWLSTVISCPRGEDDDDFEENDSLLSAAPLLPGFYDTLVWLDVDVYALDVCEAGTLTTRLFFAHDDGNLDLVVLDRDWRELARTASVNDNEELVLEELPEGLYFVGVVAPEGTETVYDLELVLDCPVIDDEYEPNNDQGEAQWIAPGRYPGLILTPFDEDWFEVDVQCDDAVAEVEILFHNGAGNLDLGVHDADGNLVGISAGEDDGEVLMDPALAAGLYYVRVWGAGGAGNDYTLRVLVSCPQEGDDRLEENDSLRQAALIEPGGHPELVSMDPDFYAVEVCDHGLLDVLVEFLHEEGDLDLDVLDHAGRPVQGSTSISDNEQVVLEDLRGGLYYVHVYGFGEATNGYDLTVTLDCELPDDGFEPNDAPDEATPLVPGRYEDLVLVPGNEDWYVVDDCPGGTLDVFLPYDHGTGLLELLLLDENQDPVGWFDQVPGGAAGVARDVGGPIYLLVTSPDEVFFAYTLDVALSCEKAGDDPLEENDRLGMARPIDPGFYGDPDPLVILADDPDWYRVEVCDRGSLTVDIVFENAAGNLELELFDGHGQPLDASLTLDDGESVSAAELEGGPYFFVVYGLEGAENTYLMDVVVDCTPPGDAYEPNDDFDGAVPLPPGYAEDYSIGPDEDWYLLADVCDGATVTVGMVGSP